MLCYVCYVMQVKSDTVLPTVRHLCDISSKEAVSPTRNDAEMGHAISVSCIYDSYSLELFKSTIVFLEC